MAKNPQSKDEALEALDFIVNVLKQHERDLDKLINELATATEQLGETGELAEKVNRVEEKISSLQKEIVSLAGNITATSRSAPIVQTTQQPVASPATAITVHGPAMIMQCKQLEDFQGLAAGAQTVSFNYKEEEKVFHLNALRGNQVITYAGPMPKLSSVLKAFLSKELGVSEHCILEGSLVLGH
jgi:DNA repair ATPase RecN